MNFHRRPDWHIPEASVTPESVFLNRRALLGGLAASAALPTVANAWIFGSDDAPELPADFVPKPGLNPGFMNAGRDVTPEEINATYNNFYEFGSSKTIARASQALQSDPWTLTIEGMVDTPMKIGVEDLIKKMPVEERVVRHRCVEAWSMVVPWIGFELGELMKLAGPKSDAKYVRFETFLDPDVASGQRQHWYPWPYVEGLTVAEAMHPLSFMVVGAYGRVLHKQFGAPMRLHLPWKYGFKSIKSITRITVTDKKPQSFWEELIPEEYGFYANVNPEFHHPRWRQDTERVLGSNDRVPTLLYNGYGEQVASLYDGLDEGRTLWY